MTAQEPAIAGRRLLRTILIILAIFLVYAFAVTATEITFEKPLDPGRQENVLRVLRLLADPDIIAVDDATGAVGLSTAATVTIERIIETIFMALLASTVGTALAVPLSFIAARNLMAPVTMPLAAIMAGVVGLPIGGLIGGLVADFIQGIAGALAAQTLLAAGILLGVALLIWLIFRFGSSIAGAGRIGVTNAIRLLLIILLLIFALALLAQVGLIVGAWLDDNLGVFGFLGNFVFVLSDFLRILLPALVTLLAALVASSYGSRYGQEAVLSLEGWPARLVTAVLAALGAAVIVFAIGSALNWLYQFDSPENWTTIPAAVAAGAGLVLGLLIPPKRPFRIGFGIYSVTRGLLNVLRSIEPLIMGIVFVVWVSLGPFAGIMALTLHSIAALGKLFSEQVEGISEGPVEAITATGASRLQMITYAVIPQIIPPFTAFALYRWDINVRMSTIIGFVGGGGIGFVLSQNIQQLRYRQASVMMLAIAIVIMTLDWASSRIRSRII